MYNGYGSGRPQHWGFLNLLNGVGMAFQSPEFIIKIDNPVVN